MKTIEDKSPLDKILDWHRQSCKSPSARDLQNQTADYLSAMTSFLVACQEIGSTSPAREELSFSVNIIDFIQRRIRAHSLGIELNFDEADREMVLRTLCAQIHACIGLAHMMEMDIGGALKERVESDQSRLGSSDRSIFSPNYIQFT